MPQWRWGLAVLQTWRALLLGEAQEAERHAEAAFELAQASGQPEAFTFYVGALFVCRYVEGRLGELLSMTDQLLAADDSMAAVQAVWAMCHALEGDHAPVRISLDEQVARGFDAPYDCNWLNTLLPWAEAAVELGHTEAAALLLAMLEPWPDRMQSGPVLVLPGVAYALGRLSSLLGRHDDAERYFAQSLVVHERLQAPFLVAQTKLSWAAARLERGGIARPLGVASAPATSELLGDALDVARRLGFAGVERKALLLLTQAEG